MTRRMLTATSHELGWALQETTRFPIWLFRIGRLALVWNLEKRDGRRG